jgi:hypothetical protein
MENILTDRLKSVIEMVRYCDSNKVEIYNDFKVNLSTKDNSIIEKLIDKEVIDKNNESKSTSPTEAKSLFKSKSLSNLKDKAKIILTKKNSTLNLINNPFNKEINFTKAGDSVFGLYSKSNQNIVIKAKIN